MATEPPAADTTVVDANVGPGPTVILLGLPWIACPPRVTEREKVPLTVTVKEAVQRNYFDSIHHSMVLQYHNNPTDCSTCHWSKDYLVHNHYFQLDSSKEQVEVVEAMP